MEITITNPQTGESVVFPEAASDGWWFTDLVDWFSTPGDKVSVDERPQGHGAFDVDRVWRQSAGPSFKLRWWGVHEFELA